MKQVNKLCPNKLAAPVSTDTSLRERLKRFQDEEQVFWLSSKWMFNGVNLTMKRWSLQVLLNLGSTCMCQSLGIAA